MRAHIVVTLLAAILSAGVIYFAETGVVRPNSSNGNQPRAVALSHAKSLQSGPRNQLVLRVSGVHVRTSKRPTSAAAGRFAGKTGVSARKALVTKPGATMAVTTTTGTTGTTGTTAITSGGTQGHRTVSVTATSSTSSSTTSTSSTTSSTSTTPSTTSIATATTSAVHGCFTMMVLKEGEHVECFTCPDGTQYWNFSALC